MKNKKFSWLLNVATIALCICAIAIGVYSAKTASLSISGSIGFTAPDCIVEVSGTYLSHESTEATERKTYTLFESETDNKKTIGGTASETAKVENLSLFFSAYDTEHGDEIVFNLNITNKSIFSITVESPAPKLTNESGVSIDGVTCTSSNEKFSLATSESATVVFTYKIDNIAEAESFNDGKFSITLNCTKGSVLDNMYTKSITEKLYTGTAYNFEEVTTTKLCTTMGHSIAGDEAGQDGTGDEDIVWYAFAVKGVDTGKGYVYKNNWYENNTDYGALADRWYSLSGINFNDDFEIVISESNNVSAKGQTFWFIQQYVTAGGYYMDTTTSSFRYGVIFNENGTNYNNIYKSSSLTSKIYTYLTDTESSSNYLSATEIKDEWFFNNCIDERSVSETYQVDFSADYTTTNKDGYNECTIEFSSKLWLISTVELGLLTNNLTLMNITSYNATKTFGIGNQGDSADNGASWWLRSPHKANSWNAIGINSNSSNAFTNNSVVDGTSCGIRAAFQITI